MAAGAAVLAGLVGWLGVDPFLEPLRRIDPWTLAAATAIAVLTTAACAWRWRLVSRALGSELPAGDAIAAYYRSQFLNTVLPGGVLGDVHRAAHRGRQVGDLGHAARVVVWERTAGQAVQIVWTLAVLLLLPSPIRPSIQAMAFAALVCAPAVLLALRARPRRGPSTVPRLVGTLAGDVRALLSSRVCPGVLTASTVVVAGHAATFVIAARAAGTPASVRELLPLALLVLLVTALPVSVAGWGPREAGAAGVFATAGMGAAQGVSTAVMYGVLVLVATAPGAVVMLVAWLRPRTATSTRVAVPSGVGHG